MPAVRRHLVPGDVGQAEVKDDQVERAAPAELERLGSRAGRKHDQVFAFEVRPHELAELVLVFDDHHGRHQSPPRQFPPRQFPPSGVRAPATSGSSGGAPEST